MNTKLFKFASTVGYISCFAHLVLGTIALAVKDHIIAIVMFTASCVYGVLALIAKGLAED